MDILDTLFDLDASAVRTEMRRTVDEARKYSEQWRAAFNSTWRCPVWNDTDIK